jgi:hypothetical protein
MRALVGVLRASSPASVDQCIMAVKLCVGRCLWKEALLREDVGNSIVDDLADVPIETYSLCQYQVPISTPSYQLRSPNSVSRSAESSQRLAAANPGIQHSLPNLETFPSKSAFGVVIDVATGPMHGCPLWWRCWTNHGARVICSPFLAIARQLYLPRPQEQAWYL